MKHSGPSRQRQTPRSRPSTPHHSSDEVRWSAVVDRDPQADSRFVYAVRTTGIYCRPSCSARRPKRANVEFFIREEDAAAHGYRPCKRCRPHQPPVDRRAELVAHLCREIEASKTVPSLEGLAKLAGLSRFHLHRLFRATTGLTPREYALGHRAGRVRRAVKTSPSITQAMYRSGFSSSGRFYEATDRALGMEPKRFKDGGTGLTVHFAIAECSLGLVLVATTDRGICAISLGTSRDSLGRELEGQFPNAEVVAGGKEFRETLAAVVRLIESPGTGPNLPLDIRGTVFQQRVWKALMAIPAGTTATYTEIARRVGAPNSVRAVATACAANRLAVAIPCHRVVRRDGSLAGYRWGLARKRELLAAEKAMVAAAGSEGRRTGRGSS